MGISTDDLEIRLGDAELMYEELEQTYWVHVSVLSGVASYLYWDIGYLSIGITVALCFVGVKYLSKKPFTRGISECFK